VGVFARQAADFVENAQLKQALRQADQRKDRALAALAHELRNPLSAIMSATQVLRLEAGTASRSGEACELIMRQARLMARLADDLIETSRVGTGDALLELENVDVNAAMVKATAAVNAQIHERRHQLAVVPPPQPVRVEADPIRLEQILVNLLINASHYTDPGGKITLAAWEEGDRVAIRVRDTGAGIAPEMLSRVFEPFVRATSESRPWLSGLGLGLALVRTLAQRQGGDVTAASDGIGKGSEFVVRLRKPQAQRGG
jgi:signal transduction histidine kinase